MVKPGWLHEFRNKGLCGYCCLSSVKNALSNYKIGAGPRTRCCLDSLKLSINLCKPGNIFAKLKCGTALSR